MKRIMLFGVLLMGLAFGRVQAAAPDNPEGVFVISQYLIEVNEVGAETTRVTGTNLTSQENPPTLSSIIDEEGLSIGNLHLSIESNGQLLANGSPDFQSEEGFRVVSAPRVVLPEGEEATLRSGSTSQYMVRQPDGDFRLEAVDPDNDAGMKLNMTVHSVDDVGQSRPLVDLEYSASTTFMVGRDPIPGVGLDIGPPVFETRRVETRLRIPLNRWVFLHTVTAREAGDGSTSRLITLVKIEERVK